MTHLSFSWELKEGRDLAAGRFICPPISSLQYSLRGAEQEGGTIRGVFGKERRAPLPPDVKTRRLVHTWRGAQMPWWLVGMGTGATRAPVWTPPSSRLWPALCRSYTCLETSLSLSITEGAKPLREFQLHQVISTSSLVFVTISHYCLHRK